jgi:ankyrin repeat protein
MGTNEKMENSRRRGKKTQAELDSALRLAARGGTGEDVRRLLGAGADPRATDPSQVTALIFATLLGNAQIVEALLGVSDLNARTCDGETALMAAAQMGCAEVVAKLLAAGADPLAVDDQGFSALMRAAKMGNVDCVDLLAPLSDLDAKDRVGQNAEEIARVHMLAMTAEMLADERRRRERETLLAEATESAATAGEDGKGAQRRKPRAL